ncbi:MAG: hypothetical protein KF909_14065 [Rhodocyclaceae bacterium]|nr:hypothetical protein [Rhodocyclaceae bacterium]
MSVPLIADTLPTQMIAEPSCRGPLACSCCGLPRVDAGCATNGIVAGEHETIPAGVPEVVQ